MALFLSPLTGTWAPLVKLNPFLPMPPELVALPNLHIASGRPLLPSDAPRDAASAPLFPRLDPPS
jgi:hypothetical protein